MPSSQSMVAVSRLGVVTLLAASPFVSQALAAGSSSVSPGCDATRAALLIGRAYTLEIGEQARILSGATTFRALPPYAPESADRDLNRLRIQLDGKGVITGFLCR